MRIAVIGTGYVGLVTSTCLANSGNAIIGVDIDQKKIDRLTNGELPIYEPGLLELLKRNLADERLRFTTNLKEGVHQSDLIFIAVGTPAGPDGTADLSNLWAVADSLIEVIDAPKIVVIKSTVPVGTNTKLAERLSAVAHPVDVASNPEFLKEGAAVEDFMKPDRVVVGVRRDDVTETLRELYAPYLRTEHPFIVMSPESAEMTKYAANAMLATKISFINEMANLCERTGADINDVRKGIGHDARIGFQFLFPGVGYGGSCFPKDISAIIAMARQTDMPVRLMEAVHGVNESQKHVLGEKIAKHFGQSLAGKTIAVWGLAFKPRTDDIREAPALALIDFLLEKQAGVRVHDPEAMNNVRAIYGDRITYCDKPYGALEGANGLAICTEWQQFRNPDFEVMRRLLQEPVIFDGRNLFEPNAVRKHGFIYQAIGRGS